MHFYMVSAYLGGFVCILMWYPHTWRGVEVLRLRTVVFVGPVYAGGRVDTYEYVASVSSSLFRGAPAWQSQNPCQEPSGLQVYYVNPCLELATAGLYSESLHRA